MLDLRISNYVSGGQRHLIHLTYHPQEVHLAQFSQHVHKDDLKPHSFLPACLFANLTTNKSMNHPDCLPANWIYGTGYYILEPSPRGRLDKLLSLWMHSEIQKKEKLSRIIRGIFLLPICRYVLTMTRW